MASRYSTDWAEEACNSPNPAVGFCEHAGEITRRFDLITDEIESLRGELSGKVCVAMPDSAGHILFVPLIKLFRAEYPQVNLPVMSAYSADIPHQLFIGNAHVGIVTHEQGLSGLTRVPFCSEELHLVGRKSLDVQSDKITLSKVSALPLLLPALGDMRKIIDRAFADAHLIPNITMEVDSQDALLNLIQAGKGYSIMSYAGVHNYVQRALVSAQKIIGPTIQRTVSVVVANNRPRTLLIRQVKNELIGLIHQLHKTAKWRLDL